MNDKWFRWEREASIHLLFPTLEVFYQPLKNYTKVDAPTMVLIFEKGVVSWCIKEDEFISYGEKLLNIFKDKNEEERMVDDINQSLKELKKVESEHERLDLKKLNNEEIISVYNRLYRAFINYYTMGAIGTPLSFSAENLLKSKGISDQKLNFFTATNSISYTVKADSFLLKSKNIKGFKKKYFWINNNYSGTEILQDQEIVDRLAQLEDKGLAVSAKKAKPVLYKLSGQDKRLVELLKNYSVYKDQRKKEILIYLHYMDSILKEVVKRTNLDIEEVRASCPFEIKDLLSRKLSKRDLKERLKFSAIVWQNKARSPLILTGKRAKNWEQKTLLKLDSSKTIKGRIASSGKTTGRARVLLKASECSKLKKGEVLVTYMTSPDFMSAIRKCSAIVTNLGGVTSHAAIISRELGVPCIVGTKIATQVLKDGDLVEIDANTGIVRIL